MPDPDELEAKEALIKRLSDEKTAQADLVKKQRDIIAQYLILDIEDYLAEARDRSAEAAEAFDPAKETKRSTVSLSHCLPFHHALDQDELTRPPTHTALQMERSPPRPLRRRLHHENHQTPDALSLGAMGHQPV